MPDEHAGEPLPPLGPLHVWGIVRGRELSFEGTLTLDDDALLLTAAPGRPGPRAPLRLRYADVEGGRGGSGAVTLYLPGGDDVVEISAAPQLAPRLDAALGEVTRRACALPELTKHLRGFGSQRAHPGSDHDRFFGTLLAARRAAARSADPLAQLRAFDPAILRGAAERALAEFAAARFPESAPDRRALEAELDEIATPLWASLDRLTRARAAVDASPDDVRFSRWRDWAALVRAVYASADRVWVAALPALAHPRAPEARPWRRLRRR